MDRIRANVVAIYEPPQESSRDSVRLLSDEREEIVEHIANSLGLRRVGWIFTDLLAEDIQKGTVKHTRNIESHFLSAQECIMAGYYQNLYPNACRYASKGYFGSKFVTVCVTGKFIQINYSRCYNLFYYQTVCDKNVNVD
ncbi:hypothetical protein NQ314_006192 [Rhamnusium bicolor]|uniref:MPN domain-containing protein n=1 Tax=Rhamnusium bicolor TaxID=1586634 RepID=A0AAV8Z6L0_9CUCU|nr:hypothetical protein NQ314_006192 [Rhamnusium bicolor]